MQELPETDSLLYRLKGIEAVSRVKSRLKEISSEDSEKLRKRVIIELKIIRTYIRDYHQNRPVGDITFHRINEINKKSYDRMRTFLLTSRDFYNREKGQNLSLEEFLT